jgi:hypothetical protein
MRAWLAIASALCIASAAAAAPKPSPGQVEGIERAVSRGQQIFAFDRAAAAADEELRRRMPDPGVTGWIAEPQGDAVRVTFYRTSGDRPQAVFSADVTRREIRSSHLYTGGENRDLTPSQTALARARAAALAATVGNGLKPCTPAPFDVVVLPGRTPSDPVAVYLLSVPTEKHEYPFGGHHEVDVSPAGQVLATHSFSDACMPMNTKSYERGGFLAAFAVTHLPDPTPTEIHVFLSLELHEALMVTTGEPEAIWSVRGQKVHLLGTAYGH